MLRHAHPGEVVPRGERHQGLAVVVVQRVEKGPPRRVSQRPEHHLHTIHNRKPNGFLSRRPSSLPSGAGRFAARRQGDPCSGLFGEVVPHNLRMRHTLRVLVAA